MTPEALAELSLKEKQLRVAALLGCQEPSPTGTGYWPPACRDLLQELGCSPAVSDERPAWLFACRMPDFPRSHDAADAAVRVLVGGDANRRRAYLAALLARDGRRAMTDATPNFGFADLALVAFTTPGQKIDALLLTCPAPAF